MDDVYTESKWSEREFNLVAIDILGWVIICLVHPGL